jgi:hypothetical protein
MVDAFSLALSHGLLALMIWRLSRRDDLDKEPPVEPDPAPTGFGRNDRHA